MPSAFASAMPKGFSSGFKRPRAKKAQVKKRLGVGASAELIRVVNMPRRSIDVYDSDFALALSMEMRRQGSNFCLKPKQAAMLVESVEAGGLFGMLGVGGGKTVVAPLFGKVLDCQPVVLLVPAALKIEITRKVIPWLQREIDFIPPHVISYNELQNPQTGDVLDRIKPKLIVCDEIHNLKNKAAARTKRFLRYLAEYPNTIVVALSGTITRRSLLDFWHIIQFTHKGKKVPVTTVWTEARDWSRAIDPQVPEDQRMLPGALLRLCRPGEDVRQGFNRRLIDTEGVIGGSAEDVGSSLVLHRLRPVVPVAVTRALERLRQYWETPAGEVVTDAKDFARKAREISQGFYYVWQWPGGKPDKPWLEARAEWRKVVSDVTKLNRQGLDSELLVRTQADHHYRHGYSELPKTMVDRIMATWEAWDAVREQEDPPTRAIWIDDFLVRAGIKWGNEVQDGIVWYDARAIGERAEELGATVCTAGVHGNTRILDLAGRPAFDPETGDGEKHVVFASSTAHGTGKNLQRWFNALCLAPWAGGATFEQVIGREHRPGQKADEVNFYINVHTLELEKALAGALEQAQYIQDVTGGAQKLLMGNWAA